MGEFFSFPKTSGRADGGGGGGVCITIGNSLLPSYLSDQATNARI